MHWDTFKQDNYITVGGDGGCRVGEVRASTTSPMPDHKVTVRNPPTPLLSEFSEIYLFEGLVECSCINQISFSLI